MKQIIIFLLIVILALIGYGKYKQYKRFTPPEYEYTSDQDIDLDYHDQEFLKSYYKAIESLNGYVIVQWSANNVDVRNPEDDNEDTLAATNKYEGYLAEVKYYEARLAQSARLKKAGHSNKDIQLMESKGLSPEAYLANIMKKKRNKMLWGMFKDELATNNLRLGSSNALIHELQKILIAKGYEIPLDGVYMNATQDALRQFEEKNGLFADGLLDALTLDKLLK